MEKKAEILNELREISGGNLQFGGLPAYGVPEGYFANLPRLVMDRIHSGSEASRELKELSPYLSAIPKRIPFRAPEGYFRGLEEQFMAWEGSGQDPLIPDWPKQSPYVVLEDYFGELPSVVMVRILQTVPAKVVPFRSMRRVLRYATAAVITGVIAIGAGIYFNPGAPNVDAQLAVLPDQAMVEYLQNPADPLDNETIYTEVPPSSQTNSLVSGFSDDDLQAYLDNTVGVSQHDLN